MVMPIQTDVEGGYRFLTAVLFLLVALPLAGYAVFPNNAFFSTFSYPSRLLLVPIHEMGHLVLIYFTEFSGISPSYMYIPILMAGSLNEVFVPFVFVFFFIFGSRRYALACLLLVVAGSAIIDWGAYVKSSPNPYGTGFNTSMEVFEVGPQNHDWYQVLTHYNMLDDAVLFGDIIMDLGFVVTLTGFFSSIFEVNRVLNYSSSSDFMLLMLYGSVPALVLSIAYYTTFRLVFSLLLLLPLLIHFYRKVLPGLKEEVKEVDEDIREEEEVENEEQQNQTEPKAS
jgi:hypothetical protein